MPFRIEDILKKDTFGPCQNPENTKEATELKNAQTESILQQTLLNRLQPPSPYYRPENVNVVKTQPYGYQRLCYPSHFYNPYVANAYPYPYERKYYSIYTVPSPTIFTGPYNIYSKRKGGQVRFTPNQTDILEKRFLFNKYLSPEDRKRLADSLKLSDRQVKTWFQNRRAKWRRSTCSSSAESSSESNEKKNEQTKLLTNVDTSR